MAALDLLKLEPGANLTYDDSLELPWKLMRPVKRRALLSRDLEGMAALTLATLRQTLASTAPSEKPSQMLLPDLVVEGLPEDLTRLDLQPVVEKFLSWLETANLRPTEDASDSSPEGWH